MASKSGQRFIKENRAPRVHIEYEVETFGSRQKIELPFVMGVMSDLTGRHAKVVERKNAKGEVVEVVEEDRVPVEDRKFEEIDMDNFESKMAGMAPRVLFNVANKLSDDDKLVGVDLTFRSMDDFSPGAVAKKVPALAKLLEARTQLADLMTYMDGRSGAQDLLDKISPGSGADEVARRRRPGRQVRARGLIQPESSITMARELQSAPAAEASTVAADDFTALLQKEFKPTSDDRRERIELSVRTMAEQALQDASVISGDVYASLGAMIAAIDARLTDQVNAIIHNPEFQKMEFRLARAVAPGQQHLDRQGSQDFGS